MGSSDAPAVFVSVVLTVRNEEPHLARLLDSLLAQQPPFEITLVDSESRDRTVAIAEDFARAHPGLLNVVERAGSRGIGRNVGVALSKGEFVAFIDGDCFADSNWLSTLRRGFVSHDIVAGRTAPVGSLQYGRFERFELFERGNDVTYPSCNLAYRRSLFLRLHGFDPRFITAEDIDLNLRAVAGGATIRFEPDAIVYHQMRSTFLRFLYQAFWNGYGRKQLTEKHGALWGRYRVRRLISNQRSLIAWFRVTAALAGYVARVLSGFSDRLTGEAPPTPELEQAMAGGSPVASSGPAAPRGVFTDSGRSSTAIRP